MFDRITAIWDETQIAYQPVNNNYARVMDTIELRGMDRQTWNEKVLTPRFEAVPDVFRYRPLSIGSKQDFVVMTERFQHWVFRINVERYFGQRFADDAAYRAWWKEELERYENGEQRTLIQDFSAMFRSGGSHTNKAGTDISRNYIAQRNLGLDFPKYFHIVTGGFVGKLADDTTRKINGVVHRPLQCIHAGGDIERYHPFTHPHLFDQPCVTGRVLVYGKGGYEIKGYFRRKYQWFGGSVVFPFCLPYDNEAWYPENSENDALVIPSDDPPLSKQDYQVGK